MDELPRILLVDDLPSIHDDFRKLLAPADRAAPGLAAAKLALFGDEEPPAQASSYALDSAYQGEAALAMVRAALSSGRPYAMAFVDMQMPPGWDGAQTAARLWEVDPGLQIVICTAYADTPWPVLLQQLDGRDRLLILKKPFDAIEVRQLASALTEKRALANALRRHVDTLEAQVAERTRSLVDANAALLAEIDERKRLQVSLIESQTLASIGQLAAGVAHEINNPAAYVLANIAAVQRFLREPGALQPAQGAGRDGGGESASELDAAREELPMLLSESIDGMRRICAIVRDLREFSRVDSSADWQVVDLHAGLDASLNLMAGEIRGVAELVEAYEGSLEVECLPSQINQVFACLLRNAVQAMQGRRGCITVATGRQDGQLAWIEVRDDGCGIEPQHLPRIFDPFFTTRPVGQGAGLGLSLAHGIVRRHGGRIEVDSAAGKGSCFRVVLPLRRSAAAQRPGAATPAGAELPTAT